MPSPACAQGGIPFASGLLAVEAGYFALEQRSVDFSAVSDPGGNPVIARPIFNNQTGLRLRRTDLAQAVFRQDQAYSLIPSCRGYEFNLAADFYRSDSSRFYILAGFRSLNLNEDLTIQDNLMRSGRRGLPGRPGRSQPTTDVDKFSTSSHFYGGQIGGH